MPRAQAPQIVDRSSARVLTVSVAWGAGIEALLALVMLSATGGLERYERGPEIERLVRRGLPRSVGRAINLLRTPAGDPWSSLIGQVVVAGGPNDLASIVARLRKMSPAELKRAMMGAHRAHPEGHAARTDELLRAAERGGWADEARPVAAIESAQLAQAVIEAVKDLPQAIYEPTGLPNDLLERNAVAAQRLIEESDDAGLAIERLTHGLAYRPEPGITDAVVIPSLVHRPWTLVLDHGSTKLFCYPARLPSELNAPDMGLIAIYRALGDGTRLRILRRLAAGRAPVARVSEDLGLAKSTVHEHLLSLRSAGLVRMSSGGGFELQPELPDLNWMLKEFLGLEMRRACEGCGKVLEPDGVAYICSYECTFCADCADRYEHVCPNCGGELVARPRRARNRSGRRPRGQARQPVR